MHDQKSPISLKRPREGEQQNQALSTIGSSSHRSVVREDKTSEVNAGQETTKSTQHGIVIRPSENLSSVKPISAIHPGIYL